MKEATLREVAQLAGVSIKTASRVANAEPGVQVGTRQKVHEAIQALNYRPNESARNLVLRRKRVHEAIL